MNSNIHKWATRSFNSGSCGCIYCNKSHIGEIQNEFGNRKDLC